jgi:hypothetical protein
MWNDLYLPTSPIFQSPEILDAFQASSSGRGLLLLFSVTGNLRGKSLGSRLARRIGGGRRRTRADSGGATDLGQTRTAVGPRRTGESWGWPCDAGLTRRGRRAVVPDTMTGTSAWTKVGRW